MHGYYYDSETQNYYLQSRYYNPEIARFISEDIYRGNPEDPLSLNYYTYCNNNPLRYNDPDGHIPVPLITAGIGGLINTGINFFGDLFDDGQINRGWKSYAGSFAEGAIIGGGFGLLGPGAGVVKTIAVGTILGFTGNSTNQLISTGNIDFKQSAISGITTGIGAGAFSIGGKITSSGFEKIVSYSIKGFNAGALGNTANQLLTKDIKDFNSLEVLAAGGMGTVASPVIAGITEKSINKWGTVNSKVTLGDKVQFGSDTKSTEKLNSQMNQRGWTEKSVKNTIHSPYTTRTSTNMSTGNPATVYYNKQGGYVIVDNITNSIVQVSDNINPTTWNPDKNIINPYRPNK